MLRQRIKVACKIPCKNYAHKQRECEQTWIKSYTAEQLLSKPRFYLISSSLDLSRSQLQCLFHLNYFDFCESSNRIYMYRRMSKSIWNAGMEIFSNAFWRSLLCLDELKKKYGTKFVRSSLSSALFIWYVWIKTCAHTFFVSCHDVIIIIIIFRTT